MSLSKLQKVLFRNTLRIARDIKGDANMIYLQSVPKREEFQEHSSFQSSTKDDQILHALFPVELQELIQSHPDRLLDRDRAIKLIYSAYRLKKFENISNTVKSANEDLALECYRVLSMQRKLTRSTSIATTRKIRVFATAVYDNESSDEEGGYLYFYRITVENTGSDFVQLLGRHWNFLSGDDLESVEKFAPGVIGQKPVLMPGAGFQYTSCARIKYKSGVMDGSLLMVNKDTTDTFEAVVGKCQLTPFSF